MPRINILKGNCYILWIELPFVKMCQNHTFKVDFLCQKSPEFFWFFFSLMNISLGAGFMFLAFSKNFNFWTTLLSKMGPNFGRSMWTSVKVKSKKYFSFTDFFAKTSAKLHHWGHANYLALHTCWMSIVSFMRYKWSHVQFFWKGDSCRNFLMLFGTVFKSFQMKTGYNWQFFHG